MRKADYYFDRNGLTIRYEKLGTINIDELRQAILTDINILRNDINIRYVKDVRLRIHATNEYGEEIKITRPEGGTMRLIDTHHYRPACKDYEL